MVDPLLLTAFFVFSSSRGIRQESAVHSSYSCAPKMLNFGRKVEVVSVTDGSSTVATANTLWTLATHTPVITSPSSSPVNVSFPPNPRNTRR